MSPVAEKQTAAKRTEARIVWVFDSTEQIYVDHSRGLAISPQVLDEYGAKASEALFAQRDVIPGALPELMRVWYERKYGPFEENL